nr:immunoglobulin heavy chain junction region [Mus musculus]
CARQLRRDFDYW